MENKSQDQQIQFQQILPKGKEGIATKKANSFSFTQEGAYKKRNRGYQNVKEEK